MFALQRCFVWQVVNRSMWVTLPGTFDAVTGAYGLTVFVFLLVALPSKLW